MVAKILISALNLHEYDLVNLCWTFACKEFNHTQKFEDKSIIVVLKRGGGG